MDAELFQMLVNIGAGTVLAWGTGWFLKNRAPWFDNQYIPMLNLVLQFVTRLVLEVSPAEAGVFGSLKSVLSGVGDIAFQSAVSTVLASGGQSSAKATGRAAFKLFKLMILDRLVSAAAKEAEK